MGGYKVRLEFWGYEVIMLPYVDSRQDLLYNPKTENLKF